MMDRFEEYVSRAVQAGIFGPGVLWRKLGNNPIIRSRVGDTFPVLFLPMHLEPPPLEAGTVYTFKEAHFGVHSFIDLAAEGPAGSIKFVVALCWLDAGGREAALHFLETTRDANGEFGGLPVSFMFAAYKFGGMGNFVSSGVLQFNAQHLVNAYTLWLTTPAADRDVLKDPRCPVCRAAGG